jgi:DNA repair ATPase RecN
MSDLDRWFKAVEEAMARFTGGATGTTQAVQEALTAFAGMPERMRDLDALLSEFGTPATQLREFEQQLSTTRQQLELSAKQLAAAENTVSRIAALAEQLALLHEPFEKAAAAWRGSTTTTDTRAAEAERTDERGDG